MYSVNIHVWIKPHNIPINRPSLHHISPIKIFVIFVEENPDDNIIVGILTKSLQFPYKTHEIPTHIPIQHISHKGKEKTCTN